MQDAKTITAISRPVSSRKYVLLTALAIFGLRAILFVILRKTAISYSSATAALSFNTNDRVALTDTLIMGFVNLPFLGFVGWFIARKMGSIRAGLLTGLKAGLFSGMAIYIIFAIAAISIATLIVLLASAFPHNQNSFFQFGGNVTWWVVRAILINNLLFIAFDMVCGVLMGGLGAILGVKLRMA